MTSQLESLVQKAIKAPSGHNTQPWKFKVEDKQITIHPDYDRALPVVDADNHALFISLGCALENLIIAAEHHGFTTRITINTQEQNKENIVVHLYSQEVKRDNLLYNSIDVRQVTRNLYDGKPIPFSDIEKLKTASLQEDVVTLMFTNETDVKPIIELAREGNNLQFHNSSFIAELTHWIRFNKNTAAKKGDGLFGATTGNPSVPTWFGKLFMKLFANAEKEDSKLVEQIKSSSVLMIFIAKRNDKKSWINVGRSFERTMLMAASMNIHHAHVNMPCEVVEVRKKLSRLLKLTEEQQPLLLIRLGHSQKMPYSFRRPIEDVMPN